MRIVLKLLVMIGVDSAVQSDVDSGGEKWCRCYLLGWWWCGWWTLVIVE